MTARWLQLFALCTISAARYHCGVLTISRSRLCRAVTSYDAPHVDAGNSREEMRVNPLQLIRQQADYFHRWHWLGFRQNSHSSSLEVVLYFPVLRSRQQTQKSSPVHGLWLPPGYFHQECGVGVGVTHLKETPSRLRALSVSSGLLCNFVAVYLTFVQFIL